MMEFIKKAKRTLSELKKVRQEIIDTRILLGNMLARTILSENSLKHVEFKVFSQFGDDGIIQYLVNTLDIKIDKFVEFGVETYEEANTRFLLINNNWRGLVIDGSQLNISYIKNDDIYWRHDLKAVCEFITVNNINQILKNNGFDGKLGILSIDIDGNDYWVWEAIGVADADIAIVEYNSLLGYERAITVPYNSNFQRMDAHYSGLFYGASLLALCDLADSKGYSLVGCNQAGVNAYFVKNSLLNGAVGIKSQTAAEGFIQARFRQARDQNKNLTFASPEEQMKEILGLPVINTRTGFSEPL